MIVTESKETKGQAKAAGALIERELLTGSKDRFIASRALLLQAAATFTNSLCIDPDTAVKLTDDAIKTDTSAVPAFNLRGVCLAEKAVKPLTYGPKFAGNPERWLEDNPELWRQSVEKIRGSLRDNELAYQFKPSQWTKTRFLGNRTWVSMQFFQAVLPFKEERRDEALRVLGNGRYQNMDDFFRELVESVKECQQLDPQQPAYLESEAEVYGLACLYYRNAKYKDETKAAEAYDNMIDALKRAIAGGLLRKVRMTPEEYFKDDKLLEPLFNGTDKIDDSVKDMIPQSS
jgi:hypothetical protein